MKNTATFFRRLSTYSLCIGFLIILINETRAEVCRRGDVVEALTKKFVVKVKANDLVIDAEPINNDLDIDCVVYIQERNSCNAKGECSYFFLINKADKKFEIFDPQRLSMGPPSGPNFIRANPYPSKVMNSFRLPNREGVIRTWRWDPLQNDYVENQ